MQDHVSRLVGLDGFRVKCVIEDGEGLSARTINKYLGVMHSILRRAQRTYGLAANAAAWAERGVMNGCWQD